VSHFLPISITSCRSVFFSISCPCEQSFIEFNRLSSNYAKNNVCSETFDSRYRLRKVYLVNFLHISAHFQKLFEIKKLSFENVTYCSCYRLIDDRKNSVERERKQTSYQTNILIIFAELQSIPPFFTVNDR